jgi:hypothetical protein
MAPLSEMTGGLFLFPQPQRKELSMNSIKEMVRDRKKVRFSFYWDKELWYVTEDGFESHSERIPRSLLRG